LSTQEFWTGDGGDAYTLRNDGDWRARTSFWRDTIPADVQTAFECGTNRGMNLRAIRACRSIKLGGVEINQTAVDAAVERGLPVVQGDLLRMQAVPMWDLTFTCGVLIHMAPDQVLDAMEQVAAMSKRYVMAVEYESLSGEEESVNYQGSDDLLWRRAYGKMYEAMGLRLVRYGDAGAGFDRCSFWLFSKGAQ
jgi:hypothetical protein